MIYSTTYTHDLLYHIHTLQEPRRADKHTQTDLSKPSHSCLSSGHRSHLAIRVLDDLVQSITHVSVQLPQTRAADLILARVNGGADGHAGARYGHTLSSCTVSAILGTVQVAWTREIRGCSREKESNGAGHRRTNTFQQC
jgi:hypothetical protein